MTLVETAQLLGNFGEFVGAIAVVLTLGYLAIQVRNSKVAVSENTKSIRSAAAAATQDSLAAINELIATDSSLASLLDRVSEQGSLEGLSSDERLRFTAFNRANVQRFESMYFRYEAGLLQPRVWTVRRNWLSGWIKTPAMAAWWLEERESSVYTDEFIEDIESVPGIVLGPSTQKA
jgi:hypothetical protein